MSLAITHAAKSYDLASDLHIFDTTGGARTDVGTWKSVLAPSAAGGANANHLRCTVGADTFDLPVTYAFDAANQLNLSLDAAIAGIPAPTPLALPGKILIDDKNDVIYQVYNAAGAPTDLRLTIACDVAVSANLQSLVLTLAGTGEQTHIDGEGGIRSFKPDHSGTGLDRLDFHASTYLNDGTAIPAEISFKGGWRLDGDRGIVVFSAHVDGDLNKPKIDLSFGAHVGLTEVGLHIYADGNKTTAAFVIGSVIEKPSGSLAWKLYLGKSDTGYEFDASFSGKRFIGTERSKYRGTVEFSGDIAIKLPDKTTPGGGTLPPLTAAARIKTSWNVGPFDGSFELSLDVTFPTTKSPQIALSGKFEWNGHSLTLKVGATDGNFDIELSLIAGNFLLYTKLIFGPGENIHFELAITYTFDGPSRRIQKNGPPAIGARVS